MKQIKKFIAAFFLLLPVIAFAQQPQDKRPSPPERKTPEEIAKIQADQMKAELALTDKQYKKVYKLLKKDQEYRQSLLESKFGNPEMGGPGGMMGGGPGMGGPGGMMGGGPGMGGPGGMMGGGPGMGGPGGGMPQGGSRPSNADTGDRKMPDGFPGMGMGDSLVSDEYLDSQELKLKKILTSEQYAAWRAKHPVEYNELPPLM